MDLCLYHSNCKDGFASALAVYWKYGNACEYVPVQYGQEPPDVKNKDVIIVDFSYPREILIQMHEDAKSLLVIDHHKTAQKELEGLEYCIFDMSKSGCALTYRHLFGIDEPPSLLFSFIEDRDLWKWELPDSREFSAGLALYPYDFDIWDGLNVFEVIKEGRIVFKYQNNLIENVLGRKIPRAIIGGYDVPCINATHLISELGNELSKGEPFAALYFDTEDKRVFSLRSVEDGVDVSEIAKKFGGGGHKHAAGFTINKENVLGNTNA